MPIDSLAPLTQLQPLVPLGGASLGVSALADAQPAGTGFAAVLNGLLDSNRVFLELIERGEIELGP